MKHCEDDQQHGRDGQHVFAKHVAPGVGDVLCGRERVRLRRGRLVPDLDPHDVPVVHRHDAVAELEDAAVVRHDDHRAVGLHGARCAAAPSPSGRSCASRAAVGSSQTSSRGSWTSARAMATRCCWPPDSCVGSASARSPRPTAVEQLRGRAHRLARGLPAIEQRHGDVLGRRQRRQQVVLLEHEADVLRRGTAPARCRDSSSSGRAEHLDLARRRIEQAGDDRDQRRLAAAATGRPAASARPSATSRSTPRSACTARVALAELLGHAAARPTAMTDHDGGRSVGLSMAMLSRIITLETRSPAPAPAPCGC